MLSVRRRPGHFPFSADELCDPAKLALESAIRHALPLFAVLSLAFAPAPFPSTKQDDTNPVPGRYRVDSETLVVCFGKVRPRDLSGYGPSNGVWVMKRKKP